MSHEFGGLVAAADLRRHGLQLPYVLNGRKHILTAGQSVEGPVIETNGKLFVLRNEFDAEIAFEKKMLTQSVRNPAKFRVRKGDLINISVAADPEGYWDFSASRYLRISTTTCTISTCSTHTNRGIETVDVSLIT